MQQEIPNTPSKKIPEDMVCFLTKKIMIDPVVVENGNTYEREAILKYFETHNTDPTTGAEIANKTITPNKYAKKRIEKYLAKHLKSNSTLAQEIYLPEALIQVLITALENNDSEKLIETLNKDNRLLSIDLKDNKNLLALACESASLDMLDRLFTQLGNNIKEYFYHQNRTEISLCLMISRRLGREGVIRFARAFDWQQKDFQDLLGAAVGNNDKDTFDIALSFGAEPTAQLLNWAYHEAKENLENKEKTEIVKMLILAGAPLHEEDYHGNNFFLHTLQDNYTALSLFLISEIPEKIDPKKFNADTNNALHIAVQQKQIKVVQALLNHPQMMNLNQVNGQRETALAIAYKNYHQDDFEILKRLILKGAETDNLLFKAIENHQPELIQFLLTEAIDTLNLQAQDEKGWTALHYAIAQNDLALVKLLIEKGLSVLVTDHEGNTPLHLAADAGLTEMANLLIENGASLKRHNANSQTPLDIANNKGYLDLLETIQATRRRLKLAPTIEPLKEEIEKLKAIIEQQRIDIQNKDNEINDHNKKVDEQIKIIQSQNEDILRLSRNIQNGHVKETRLQSLIGNITLFTKKTQKVKALCGNPVYVYCVAIFPDGRIVSGNGHSKSLTIWDSNTGQCLRTLEGHSHYVQAVAVFPDGRIVSSSYDLSLKVWDSNTGQCLKTIPLQDYPSFVNCLAVLPDGRIVSGAQDNNLKVWNPNTGQCLRTLPGHAGHVSSLAILPDGCIVSGCQDGSLKVWDPNTGQCIRTLPGHSGYVTSVAVLPNGHIVSSSQEDYSLKIWDTNTGQCIRTLFTAQGNPSSYIGGMAVLPNGHIVIGFSLNSLKILDFNTGQCLITLQEHSVDFPGSVVAVLPDGRIVSNSSSIDKPLYIWDISDWTLTARVNNNILNDIKNNNCKVM